MKLHTATSPEDLITIKQLAEHFQVPYQTVQKAAIRGSIPGCVKVLGRIYFDKKVAIANWTPAAIIQETEGRDLDGAHTGKKSGFGKGNTLGVSNRGGRPSRKVETKYLKALSNAVGEVEWTQIITKAIEQAISGDWRARKWLSDYLMGTPAKRILAEIDTKITRTFEVGERAAAVMALLNSVKQREVAGILEAEAVEAEEVTEIEK